MMAPSDLRCDECDRPAVILGEVLLCARCDQRINGAVESSNSSASRPDVAPVSLLSAPVVEASATSSLPTQSKVDIGSPASGLPFDRPPEATAAAASRKTLAAAPSFEDEVSALESQWARDEASMLTILQIDGAIGLRGRHHA